METSESIKHISEALIRFQKLVQPVVKKNTNPYFKSKYADLGSLLQECSRLAAECGLAVTQFPDGDSLTTMLVHQSGEFIRAKTPIISVKKDPQAIGSAITYFRRYAYKSVLGIPEVDDDGNAAQGFVPRERIDKMLEQFKAIGLSVEDVKKMARVSDVYAISEKQLAFLGTKFLAMKKRPAGVEQPANVVEDSTKT